MTVQELIGTLKDYPPSCIVRVQVTNNQDVDSFWLSTPEVNDDLEISSAEGYLYIEGYVQEEDEDA